VNGYDVDFLPPDWRAKRARRRHALTRSAVAGFVALVLIAVHAHALSQHSRLNDDLSLVEAEYSRARDRIQRVEELDRKKQELKRRLEQLKDILKRSHGAAIAAAISQSVPDTLALKKLEFHVSEMAGIPVYEVSILGLSPDNRTPLDFSDEMAKRRPLLTLVRVPSVKEHDAGSRREFVVTAIAPGLLDRPLAEVVTEVLAPAPPLPKGSAGSGR
jgi:Tfp pilus assembly protein PilN